MNRFVNSIHLSFQHFVELLPAIIGGIICFVITLFLANFLSGVIARYSLKRTRDPLISNFIGKILWAIVFILGTVMALGIIGLGTISNKILAGAGLTTFIVGFALKDIGENFLSGLILAFSRPYKVGNLIEITNVKGIVKDMTMRQTTVEADNGKIILIPNSTILKNPLTKYLNDDNNLRQEFSLNVSVDKVHEAVEIITNTVNSFPFVMKTEHKSAKVIIDSLNSDKIKLLIIFWFDTANFNGSKSGSRTEVMMTVFENLKSKGIAFSG